MNGLLSVVAGWLKPTPLPNITVVEAEIVGGGPHDGAMCASYRVGPVELGAETTVDGERYRLEMRRGKLVWVYRVRRQEQLF